MEVTEEGGKAFSEPTIGERTILGASGPTNLSSEPLSLIKGLEMHGLSSQGDTTMKCTL